ncbi:MAG: class I SAM-dependent methyltransferase [Bacteroidetes bacterium]|nr:class I SAM-dependent methyltransferase [Bacteroidota bacterium]
MYYDPIKNKIAKFVRKKIFLRKMFYKILGLIFLREWHVKRALRELITSSGQGFTMLDAGSGFGQYSYYCLKKFPFLKIYAVDVKEDQINDCKDFLQNTGLNRRISLAVEDLTEITHSEKFNLILSVDVMEHINEDVKVFKNFYRSLEPSGKLIVNTPSNIGGSGTSNSDDKSFIEEHARNGYSVSELSQKLQSSGFRVETVRFTYGKYGNLSWRFGIKIPMSLLNTSFLFLLILPIYYIIVLLPVLFLMILDYFSENETGAGLLVVAVKS